jgi:hypothetical protein
MDLVEAAKHYPCAKKAWIEFLGELPNRLRHSNLLARSPSIACVAGRVPGLASIGGTSGWQEPHQAPRSCAGRSRRTSTDRWGRPASSRTARASCSGSGG